MDLIVIRSACKMNVMTDVWSNVLKQKRDTVVITLSRLVLSTKFVKDTENDIYLPRKCLKTDLILNVVVFFFITQGTVRNRKDSHVFHLHPTVSRHTDKRNTSTCTFPNQRISSSNPEGKIWNLTVVNPLRPYFICDLSDVNVNLIFLMISIIHKTIAWSVYGKSIFFVNILESQILKKYLGKKLHVDIDMIYKCHYTKNGDFFSFNFLIRADKLQKK